MTESSDQSLRAQPHQRFSDFELGAKIGDGGSAEVFRARNLTFDVEVALKRWYRTLTPDERRKFYDECRLHWQLSDHPNIVRLYWAEAPPGEPAWLATELQDMSLADRLARGPLGPGESWRLARDILAGLAAIHRHNHLHRDMKPANVLLKDGRGVLCDLGIAMRIGGHTRFNAAGTDNFVAPELLAGQAPTARSDVYSAAVTIDLLFPRHRPAALKALLDRATSRDLRRRPKDATAFLDELTTIAPMRRTGIRGRLAGARIAVALAVGAAVIIGTAALAFGWPARSPHRPPAGAPTIGAPEISAVPTARSSISAAASPDSAPSRHAGPTAVPSAGQPVAPPTAGRCRTKVSTGTAIDYSRKLFSSPSGAATMTTSGSTATIRFDRQYTWAGLFLTLPKGVCRYRVDLEARIVEPTRTMTDGEGWGYGLGPCNLLTNGRPFGYSLQNAMIRLNGQESGNSGVFHNPDVNDGRLVDVPADYNWHQWTLDVDGSSVRITREFGVAVTHGPVSGASSLPQTCDNAGIFLRVFNGAAAFRQISITGL